MCDAEDLIYVTLHKKVPYYQKVFLLRKTWATLILDPRGFSIFIEFSYNLMFDMLE